MANSSHFGGDNMLPMSVAEIGFLLDRLGQDCHPLQFLRELTQNSIDAIKHTGKSGEITWDVDWTYYDLTGIYKLSVVDNGVGMTGEEMIKFINQLSSSLTEQSFSGNYGVGAKISAATRNHHGVVYVSWKNGEGATIHLYRDKLTRQYGLKQWKKVDGSYDYYLPISDDIKPEIIKDYGTKVVLHGATATEDTMSPPDNTPSPSRWVSKYLNTRYFCFPEGITVKAREGWTQPRSDKDRNILRQITGQEKYLNMHSEAAGKVQLTNATAYWWILKDEPAITNNSGFIESAGHMAALYQDELYEVASARAGMAKLQQFGITFGYRFVVIYIEPIEKKGIRLTTNTARTQLILNDEPLPWAEWAMEFRDMMPEEIKRLIEEKAAGASSSDHTKSIRERLRELSDLFNVSRYKPVDGGTALFDEERVVHSGLAPESAGAATLTGVSDRLGSRRAGQKDGEIGNIYALFEKKDGKPGEKVKSDPFPRTVWVSVHDGTRKYGDIEDRAAKYLEDQNLLMINADFRVFNDMVERFVKDFGDVPGIRDAVVEAVRTWFEQSLVETIMGVHALRNSKEWSVQDIADALSEISLASAVMQRYHILNAVKRHLGIKFGAAKVV